MQIKKYSPKDQTIKCLIYGSSWVGKTSFWATAPNPIFASSEKWLMSIRKFAPAYTEINSLWDLKELLTYLSTEKHDYETVIIDSITEINDIIKSAIEKKNSRSMQLQDWWTLSKEIKTILRWFRDLPMHVIFIAQEMSDMDERKVVKILPSLNWKSATDIAYYMDVVWYVYIDKKDGKRRINTSPHSFYLSKDRTNVIDGWEEQNFSEWVKKVQSDVEVHEEETLYEKKPMWEDF
jgi:hypothetical protein